MASVTSASEKPTRSASLTAFAARFPLRYLPIELGAQIVLVEDHRRSPAAQLYRGEQEEIGRVTGLNDIEERPARQPADEAADTRKRGAVFPEMAECPRPGSSHIKAMDLHAFEALECRFVAALSFRADDGHVPAGPTKRKALGPRPDYRPAPSHSRRGSERSATG